MLNTEQFIQRNQEIDDMTQAELLADCFQEDSGAMHLIIDHMSVLNEYREIPVSDMELASKTRCAFSDLADAYKNFLKDQAMQERQDYSDVRDAIEAAEIPAQSASVAIDRDNANEINRLNNFRSFTA